MLALRSALAVDPRDARVAAAATGTVADAALFDLVPAIAAGDGPSARRAALRQARAAAARGRVVLVRFAGARSGALEDDAAGLVDAAVDAVVLASAERAQDVRDADVAIRKHEMRRGIEPGAVRLIAEIGSAAGVQALPAMFEAVDRHAAVAIDATALAADLRLPPAGGRPFALEALDAALAELAIAAAAGDLPWIVSAAGCDAGFRAALAARARERGASGVVIASESEAGGLTSLFTPPDDDVTRARAVIVAWSRLQRAELRVGEAAGVLVDRRAAARAGALVAFSEAIARRERGR